MNKLDSFLVKFVLNDTRSIVLTHLSDKNNSPHLAESTVLYYIGDMFEGDIQISKQDGPDVTHYIGEENTDSISQDLRIKS